MTAVARISTGGRIVALDGRNCLPQAVIKVINQADGVVNSPPVLVNDTELYLPVAASTTYLFASYICYDGEVHASGGDLVYKWVVPSGAKLRFTSIGITTAGAVQSRVTQQDSTTYTLETTGAGTLMAATMLGTLVMGTTAGTLQFMFTTNTFTGVKTTIYAQSFLALWETT